MSQTTPAAFGQDKKGPSRDASPQKMNQKFSGDAGLGVASWSLRAARAPIRPGSKRVDPNPSRRNRWVLKKCVNDAVTLFCQKGPLSGARLEGLAVFVQRENWVGTKAKMAACFFRLNSWKEKMITRKINANCLALALSSCK